MPQTFDLPAVELHVRLPADLHERLSAVAQVERTTRNSLLVRAAQHFLHANTPDLAPSER